MPGRSATLAILLSVLLTGCPEQRTTSKAPKPVAPSSSPSHEDDPCVQKGRTFRSATGSLRLRFPSDWSFRKEELAPAGTELCMIQLSASGALFSIYAHTAAGPRSGRSCKAAFEVEPQTDDRAADRCRRIDIAGRTWIEETYDEGAHRSFVVQTVTDGHAYTIITDVPEGDASARRVLLDVIGSARIAG